MTDRIGNIRHLQPLKPLQNLSNVSQVIDDGQSNFRGSAYSNVLLSCLLLTTQMFRNRSLLVQ